MLISFPKEYQFALKTYRSNRKDIYEQDRNAFEALRGQDRSKLIQYYGSFKQGSTYNILLEYADSDLNEFFADNRPPVTSKEIFGFWKGLIGVVDALQSIHELDVSDEYRASRSNG